MTQVRRFLREQETGAYLNTASNDRRHLMEEGCKTTQQGNERTKHDNHRHLAEPTRKKESKKENMDHDGVHKHKQTQKRIGKRENEK